MGLEVGDRVMMSSTSRYYLGTFSNPIDIVGTVIKTRGTEMLWIQVKWDNRGTNTYGPMDLVLVDGVKLWD